ncbi:MAG: hypothetical protein RMJ30_03675 [Nitrososphaerota archaeon]|nr:hypothetical protein [Nitrososphaerota archaeon]
MRPWEVLDPRALADSLSTGVRFRRAFAVFGIAAAMIATSGVVNTVLLTEWVYPFASFREIALPFTSARDVAFASVGYLVIGTVVVMFTLAAVSFASGRRGFSAELVSVVLHASAFVAVASALVLAYGLVAEQRTFYVVGVEVEGFKAENVSYAGKLIGSGDEVRGVAEVARAKRLEMRVEPNDVGSLKDGNYRERVVLRGLAVRANRTVSEVGDVVVSSITYDLMSYESLESVDIVPRVQREPISAAISVGGWVSMVVHSCWTLKIRMRAGKRWAAGAAVAVTVVLLVLGIL